jgi:hypothetical protein
MAQTRGNSFSWPLFFDTFNSAICRGNRWDLVAVRFKYRQWQSYIVSYTRFLELRNGNESATWSVRLGVSNNVISSVRDMPKPINPAPFRERQMRLP